MQRRLALMILPLILLSCAHNPERRIGRRTEQTDDTAGYGIGTAPDYEGLDYYEIVPIAFDKDKFSNGVYVD
jgi:hypothetical protein